MTLSQADNQQQTEGNTMRRAALPAVIAATILLVIPVIAACGSSPSSGVSAGGDAPSSEKSGGSSVTVGSNFYTYPGYPAYTAAQVSKATAAGEAAGKAAGQKVALPKNIKIGWIDELATNEASATEWKTFASAAEYLGWQVVVCDANGSTEAAAACATKFLTQHYSVIISTGFEASLLAPELRQAKQQGVPWFNVDAMVTPNSMYTASIVPEEEYGGQLAADYILSRLKGESGKPVVAVYTYTSIYALAVRYYAFESEAKKSGQNLSIVTHSVDFTNAVDDTIQSANAIISANPDLKALDDTTGLALPEFAQVATQHYGNVQFPKRPLLVGIVGETQFLDTLRNKTADAVVAYPFVSSSLEALDQIAEYLVRHRPVSANATVPGYYDLTGLNDPVLVTQQNVPPAGAVYASPTADAAAFFRAKWSTEFKGLS
jgi:ABC-type sugar transport system substrate-binding protein